MSSVVEHQTSVQEQGWNWGGGGGGGGWNNK